jgi:hypothetical protein
MHLFFNMLDFYSYPSVVYMANASTLLYVTHFSFFIYFKINGVQQCKRHLHIPHVQKCILNFYITYLLLILCHHIFLSFTSPYGKCI